MYNFLNDNSIYVVLVVALINWFGLFVYLMRTESKLNRLEKQYSSNNLKSKGKNE